MAIKKCILFFLFFKILNIAPAQSLILRSTNKDLKFSIVQMSERVKGLAYGFMSTKILLEINKPLIDTISNYDKNVLLDVLSNFENEELDWYSNALLYHLTKQDATIIYGITLEKIHEKGLFEYDKMTVDIWKSYFKETEFSKWTKYINELPVGR